MNSVVDENQGMAMYTPQIKILKRNRNNDIKRDLQKPNAEAELKKALKLREAEYQAARNRILGENYDNKTKTGLRRNKRNQNIYNQKAFLCISVFIFWCFILYITYPTIDNLAGQKQSRGFKLIMATSRQYISRVVSAKVN